MSNSYSVLRRIRDGEAVTIACLGDSITAGYQLGGGTSSQPYPARLQNLLRQYYANPNVTVVNAGVPGNTTGQMLARFQTDVMDCAPDLIVFNGGTNDSREANGVSIDTFASNVEQILASAGDVPVIVLGITPRFEEQHSDNGEGVIDFYRRTLCQIAAAHNLPYIDAFAGLHGLYKARGYARGTVSPDGSHYSDQGYMLLGELVFTEAFANDDLRIRPGQFKDMGGQWVVSDAAATSWAIGSNPDGKALIIAPGQSIRLYLYVEGWDNCALVLHAALDSYNGSGMAVTALNQAMTGASRTFGLSPKVSGCQVFDYPLPTVKLRPGLNNVVLTAGANGARLTGLSVLPIGDQGYLAPFADATHGGMADALWPTRFGNSPQSYRRIGRDGPTVIGNSGTGYVEDYFLAIPDHDGATSRWRARANIAPGAGLYFGQQQSAALGVSYVYAVTFDNGVAKVQIQSYDGTLRTCASPAFAVASGGQDVTIDMVSGPTGWSLLVDGKVIFADTVPLSIGQVFVTSDNGTRRAYFNPPLMKGSNASDSGVLAAEEWVAFGDCARHLVSTSNTDKSVDYV